jgi:hypothetical protein
LLCKGAADPASQLLKANPLVLGQQVMKLDRATYMAWIAVPSTGHPHMFDTALMERLTSAPW